MDGSYINQKMYYELLLASFRVRVGFTPMLHTQPSPERDLDALDLWKMILSFTEDPRGLEGFGLVVFS